MQLQSCIKLKDLKLETQIGTYKPGDTVPDKHILDLTLWINSSLVLIQQDGMEYVFDYDPLILEIDQLAQDGHYETQERLITRIVGACANYVEIESMEISLRKSPVRSGSGSLGVQLFIDQATLASMRDASLSFKT